MFKGSCQLAANGNIVLRIAAVAMKWAKMSAVLMLSGCFNPQYDLPYCAPNGECPDGLICRSQEFGSPACEVPNARNTTTIIGANILDFLTYDTISTEFGVIVSDVMPAPEIDLQGDRFSARGVPANSIVWCLTTAPTRLPTYNMLKSPQSGAAGTGFLMPSREFIMNLANEFNINPSPFKGILFLYFEDIWIMSSDFTIAGTNGPHYFFPKSGPAPGGSWVAFFDVPVGVADLSQNPNSTTSLAMPTVPIAAGAVTIAGLRVRDGVLPDPIDVKFATQIVPIFQARGCLACHFAGGIEEKPGELVLEGSADFLYRELVSEKPNTRVQVTAPEMSLMLTMPSLEATPDAHPNVMFAGRRDPDYLKLLVWIREGALPN